MAPRFAFRSRTVPRTQRKARPQRCGTSKETFSNCIATGGETYKNLKLTKCHRNIPKRDRQKRSGCRFGSRICSELSQVISLKGSTSSIADPALHSCGMLLLRCQRHDTLRTQL